MHRGRYYVFLLTTAVTSALAVAGCGSGSRSDRAQIKQTWRSYEQAIGAGDGATACGLVTSQLRSQLATNARDLKVGSTCADYVASIPIRERRQRARFHTGPPGKLALGKVILSGDSASAELHFTPAPLSSRGNAHASFVERDGRWLVGETRKPG